MASYRGHLAFSAALGVAYGGLAVWKWDFDWGTALLAAGLTTVGGLLPDLDSDSGVPVRELFGLAAALTPILLYRHLLDRGLTHDQTFVVLIGVYLLIRYALSDIFKRWTVHRGMFHSIPALLIAGLVFYLSYPSDQQRARLFLAGGVMLGFLSHLVLDEIYSVDFMGLRLHLNKYAGSALKLTSKSLPATLATYLILAVLGYLAWIDWNRS
jgi:membrane-bound metal-dependent hydrolase YbcI (DUF457 family)